MRGNVPARAGNTFREAYRTDRPRLSELPIIGGFGDRGRAPLSVGAVTGNPFIRLLRVRIRQVFIVETSEYEQAAQSAEVVAFDVFDTLITRPFMRPTDLFRFMEKEYQAANFASARILAERLARKAIRQEIDLDEIYTMMDEGYQFLKDREKELEVAYTVADVSAKALYDKVLGQGKRIILISDMYLPESVLAEMLSVCGYGGYERLFLSNVADRNKASGNIYDHIVSDLGVPADRIVMIGDNKKADVDNAVRHGLKAVRWVPLKERYAPTHRKEMSFFRRRKTVDASMIVAVDMLMWAEGGKHDYWYDIARRFGGPMAYSFGNYLIANSQGFDRIIFFSRDGHIPMLAYKELGGTLPSSYVYCSRKICTAMGNLNLADRDSPYTVLRYLYGTGRLEDIALESMKDFESAREYFEKNEETVREACSDALAEYRGYLASELSGACNVLAVDTTTMRYSSQTLVDECTDARITGAYYATTAAGEPEHIVYKDRTGQRLTWSYVNLAEFFFSSAESPLEDVRDGKPVFSSEIPPEEAFRQRIQPSLEEGQMDYIRFASGLFRKNDICYDPDTVDAWLRVLISSEKGSDENRLSGFRWGVDKGHRDYRPLLFRASQLPFAIKQKVAGKLK